MQSKKKLIKKAKAKQKQEDSKLLPLKLIWNMNQILPEWREVKKCEAWNTMPELIQADGIKKREANSFLDPGMNAFLLGLATWEKYKVIYKFDQQLAKDLCQEADQLLTSNVPIEVLDNLSFPSIWIETNILSSAAFGFTAPIEGFFVSMQFPTLMFTFATSKMELKNHAIVYDNNRTIAEAMPRVYLDDLAVKSENSQTQEFIKALSLVLYLCANNADVRESKRSKNRISGAGSVTEWDVGVRYGNAIRAYAAKEGKSHKGSHSRKRPHWRKGHFQHYWTGPKSKPEERKLILNWIEPVLVNEELASIDKLPAVIHKVENDRK